jgi:hypothetical protein
LPVHIVKPNMNDTEKLYVYVDNWFKLYINGKLAAVDSIEFMPHNIVSVDVLPEFPMTIAIMASDLDLHNTVIFRTTIDKSVWKPRWNTGTPAWRIEDLK